MGHGAEHPPTTAQLIAREHLALVGICTPSLVEYQHARGTGPHSLRSSGSLPDPVHLYSQPQLPLHPLATPLASRQAHDKTSPSCKAPPSRASLAGPILPLTLLCRVAAGSATRHSLPLFFSLHPPAHLGCCTAHWALLPEAVTWLTEPLPHSSTPRKLTFISVVALLQQTLCLSSSGALIFFHYSSRYHPVDSCVLYQSSLQRR